MNPFPYQKELNSHYLKFIFGNPHLTVIADYSAISAFIIKDELNGMFEYCDVVIMNLNVVLRGPHANVVFTNNKRKMKKPKLKHKHILNLKLYQENLNVHLLTNICISMNLTKSDLFSRYVDKTRTYANYMINMLLKYKFQILQNKTNFNFIAINLKNKNIEANKLKAFCKLINIEVDICNFLIEGVEVKHLALSSSSIVSRQFTKLDLSKLIDIFNEALEISVKINEDLKISLKGLKFITTGKFIEAVEFEKSYLQLKQRVIDLSERFTCHIF